MHMLDMYTREKANKLHLDKMRRDRPHLSLLREMSSTRTVTFSKWMRLMLIFATILLLPGTLLIRLMSEFKTTNIGDENATLIRPHTA